MSLESVYRAILRREKRQERTREQEIKNAAQRKYYHKKKWMDEFKFGKRSKGE